MTNTMSFVWIITSITFGLWNSNFKELGSLFATIFMMYLLGFLFLLRHGEYKE